MKWNKIGVPHKGWRYVCVVDLGECSEPGEPINYEECEMCGKDKIRYVHLLEHPDYNGEMRVGCMCASKMSDDYVNPKESEKKLKNRAKRKLNFMKQEWRFNSNKGSYTLRYKGSNITIIKSKYNTNWGVVFKDEFLWYYNKKKITDLYTAKIAAFNLVDEINELQE